MAEQILNQATAACRVLLALVLLSTTLPVDAARAILIVRHADRLDETPDSPLSEAGRNRAEQLAEVLKHAGISAIYTSQAQRTIQTAAPLARRLGVAPVQVARDKTDELLDRLRRHGDEDIVLVVAHSGSLRGQESGMSIPVLLERLRYKPEVRLERMEYDAIFVVFPQGQADPAVVRLRF